MSTVFGVVLCCFIEERNEYSLWCSSLLFHAIINIFHDLGAFFILFLNT